VAPTAAPADVGRIDGDEPDIVANAAGDGPAAAAALGPPQPQPAVAPADAAAAGPALGRLGAPLVAAARGRFGTPCGRVIWGCDAFMEGSDDEVG